MAARVFLAILTVAFFWGVVAFLRWAWQIELQRRFGHHYFVLVRPAYRLFRSRRFATEQEAERALARTPADKREGAFIDEIHEVE